MMPDDWSTILETYHFLPLFKYPRAFFEVEESGSIRRDTWGSLMRRIGVSSLIGEDVGRRFLPMPCSKHPDPAQIPEGVRLQAPAVDVSCSLYIERLTLQVVPVQLRNDILLFRLLLPFRVD